MAVSKIFIIQQMCVVIDVFNAPFWNKEMFSKFWWFQFFTAYVWTTLNCHFCCHSCQISLPTIFDLMKTLQSLCWTSSWLKKFIGSKSLKAVWWRYYKHVTWTTTTHLRKTLLLDMRDWASGSKRDVLARNVGCNLEFGGLWWFYRRWYDSSEWM